MLSIDAHFLLLFLLFFHCSTNNDSHKEANHDEENEEETFPSEQDRNSEENQASYRVNASSFLLNYQSYMDKTPTVRWSKQDTELFYGVMFL